MAVKPVLADSSYYIQWIREGRDPLKYLTVTAATRDVAICSIVRCEVGRGVRSPKVLQRFHAAWDKMIHVPTDEQIWREVEDMSWKLDRSGIILPLTDVVIAACAKRIDAIVLSLDDHFRRIPGIRVVTQLEL